MTNPYFLEYYGDPLAAYRGIGQLTSDSGSIINCEFEAGQMRTGMIILLCKFSNVQRLESINSFQGRTFDNYRVSSTDFTIGVPWSERVEMRRHRGIKYSAVFTPKTITVEPLQAEKKKPPTLRFGLVNLKLMATDKVNDFPRRVLSLQLIDGTNSYKVILEPVSDYKERIEKVGMLKSIDVTCEAVLNLYSGQKIEDLTEVIDNLCYILSVARGTKINWVYRGMHSSDDVMLCRLHGRRTTKPYTALSIIDPNNPHDTKVFVEQVYSTYAKKKDAYYLHRGTIDAYLDAKQEADFLEMRGLKMAVAMEIITKHLGRAIRIDENILDEGEFGRLENAVKGLIKKEILQGPEMRNKRCLVYSKIRELKRRPFRNLIEEIISPEGIDLPLSGEELKLLVKCRNALVHHGDFYCNIANNDDRKKCPPKSTPADEYFFVTNVLDRMILKMLGYQGAYIDCSHSFSRKILR